MNERPQIKIALNAFDKLVETLGWTVILAIWIITIATYTDLPNIIPTHYNGAGEADAFGDKSNILSLPFVATILFVALSIFNKFPHVFNYSVDITPENALVQYTNATKLLRYLKLIVAIIFSSIAVQTIRTADSKDVGLGVWFLPVVLVMIFVPIAYFLMQSWKKGN